MFQYIFNFNDYEILNLKNYNLNNLKIMSCDKNRGILVGEKILRHTHFR